MAIDRAWQGLYESGLHDSFRHGLISVIIHLVWLFMRPVHLIATKLFELSLGVRARIPFVFLVDGRMSGVDESAIVRLEECFVGDDRVDYFKLVAQKSE